MWLKQIHTLAHTTQTGNKTIIYWNWKEEWEIIRIWIPWVVLMCVCVCVLHIWLSLWFLDDVLFPHFVCIIIEQFKLCISKMLALSRLDIYCVYEIELMIESVREDPSSLIYQKTKHSHTHRQSSAYTKHVATLI